MAKNNYGMSYEEISTIQTINPETAAHNIASAYVHSAYRESNFPKGCDVEFNSVAKIAETYEYAYNYAYNYTVHSNKVIDGAE